MDNKRIDRLEDKLDELYNLTHKQDVQLERLTGVLERNTDSLITHEKRTTLSEKRLEEFEKLFIQHLQFIKGSIKTVGVIFSIFVTVAGLLYKFGFFS